MNCYFCGSIPAPPAVVELHELEARHAAASRRQRPGDSIALIDGKGTRARGTIRTIDRSSVQVGIESRTISKQSKPRVTIASAPFFSIDIPSVSMIMTPSDANIHTPAIVSMILSGHSGMRPGRIWGKR